MSEALATEDPAFPAPEDLYHLDELARPDVIPCVDGLFGTLLSLIPFGPDEAFTVFFLGAGSGVVAESVKHFFPEALAFLLDPDDARLDLARGRLEGYSRISTMATPLTGGPYPSGGDVAIAALGAAPLGAVEAPRLYREVFKALKPGGRLLIADGFRGASIESDTLALRLWGTALAESGSEAPASLLQALADARGAPVDDQLTYLAEAGFEEREIWFRQYGFGVIAATRPRETAVDVPQTGQK